MGSVNGIISGFSNAVQFADKNNVNLFSGKPNPVMEEPFVPQALPIPKVGINTSENLDYPPNNGFQGETKQDYLMPGDIVDRYGAVSNDSRFSSTEGTSIEMRSLAPDANTSEYNRYMVLKPIPVTSGTIAPDYGQPGGGPQFQTVIPINTLLMPKHGFLIKF